MPDAQFPIQLVARLTGLSAHVIRIWEQRYRAVEPRRTATKRRLYSQSEIERLSLLRDATHAGHSIGQVAQLPTDKLGKLVAASPNLQARAPRAETEAPRSASFHEECVAAIQSLDAHALDEALKRGATALGALGLLQRVVPVVLHGDRTAMWKEGLPDFMSARPAYDAMLRQVTESVRWADCVRWALAQGATTFVEFGPGKVLSGLIKRIDKNAVTLNTQDVPTLDKVGASWPA